MKGDSLWESDRPTSTKERGSSNCGGAEGKARAAVGQGGRGQEFGEDEGKGSDQDEGLGHVVLKEEWKREGGWRGRQGREGRRRLGLSGKGDQDDLGGGGGAFEGGPCGEETREEKRKAKSQGRQPLEDSNDVKSSLRDLYRLGLGG